MATNNDLEVTGVHVGVHSVTAPDQSKPKLGRGGGSGQHQDAVFPKGWEQPWMRVEEACATPSGKPTPQVGDRRRREVLPKTPSLLWR